MFNKNSWFTKETHVIHKEINTNFGKKTLWVNFNVL